MLLGRALSRVTSNNCRIFSLSTSPLNSFVGVLIVIFHLMEFILREHFQQLFCPKILIFFVKFKKIHKTSFLCDHYASFYFLGIEKLHLFRTSLQIYAQAEKGIFLSEFQ